MLQQILFTPIFINHYTNSTSKYFVTYAKRTDVVNQFDDVQVPRAHLCMKLSQITSTFTQFVFSVFWVYRKLQEMRCQGR